MRFSARARRARVAMMIASGIDPSKIAAITFTEPAASELEARIRWTVDELRHGRQPPALVGVLSLPLGTAARAHLDEAAPRIGEITATTIHGFCQGIIRAHGIDAGLDPGSRVVDETLADALFDEVLATWLKKVLAGEKLSPVLLAEGDIADGYHRVSLAYALDPYADVPLKLG